MDIVQNFYDQLAEKYDQLFLDWQATTQEQAIIIDRLIRQFGFDSHTPLLDCACGIGTQAIGLARLGYPVTASDISEAELKEAEQRAGQNSVTIRFAKADFRNLSRTFSEPFSIVIAMDNALPHMLTPEDLDAAVGSIADRIKAGGICIASIRDYDALLASKPCYAPPYIHKTAEGQRVAFQTWDWHGDRYDLIQYIIEDAASMQVSKFTCTYRATRRAELTELFQKHGCSDVTWLFPAETGFYQPIVIAHKNL